ncbi:MAG TPA: PBP1A family penicillin-binding protein [Chloroflexota bacterium]|nr:PBP1A family penicillin-binding protein [Chloroflexota bacterium]
MRPSPTARMARRNARLRQGPRRPHGARFAVLRRVLLTLAVAVPIVLFAVVSLGVGVSLAAYQSVVRDLPSVAALPERPLFKTTEILDRYGNTLYQVFDQQAGKRTMVTLGEVPAYLINATVATEDADFFTNPGIDLRGIARAAREGLEAGRVVGGGSTITQQLVKNVLIPPEERYEVSFSRKIREAILAFQLSRTYSKDQILEMYLNEIYYGNLAYGVEAAAQTYFGKSVQDLSLAECAMLAGLPQLPAVYDPFKDPAAAHQRQAQVLDLMVRHGYIDAATAEAAKAEPLTYTTPDAGRIVAPHFVMYVRDLLAQKYGQRALFQAGLRVYTTLDPDTQRIAEEVVAKHIPTLARQDARNAGLVALDPRTGEILAMVGSPDYFNANIDGQVNATIADRQPGSAIKPIVYLAAFQRGFGPATVVLDQPTRFPDGPNRFYSPENFDKRFRGPVTLRRALGNSLNIPAVKVLQYVGVREAVRLARQLGITSLSEDHQYGLSFTLGGTEVKLLELAGAYQTLANGGYVVPTDPILRIEDSNGHVLEERAPPPTEPTVDPRLTFMISDILADNNARLETFGVNNPLRLSHPASVKTGSTDDYRDSWTVGYTPSLLAGVWVGNSDGHPMRFVLGSSGAGLIWHDFMEKALEGTPPEPYQPPDGLIRGSVCTATGYLAAPGCATTTDWFLAEHPPRPANAPKLRVAIDKQSNKLATEYCPLQNVEFRTFGGAQSGEGPYAPTEYCDLHGPQTGRPQAPWENAPTTTPTPSPTPIPPTAVSSRVVLGPTLAPLPTFTPRPTRSPTPLPLPTAVPTPSRTPAAGAPVVRLVVGRPPATATPASAGASPTYHPWANLPNEVELTYPTSDQTVDGVVPILGSASAPYFDRYAVQYGEGDAPSAWQFIGPSRTQPVRAGVLDTWDTSALPDGRYTLVLSLVDSRGEQFFARQLVTVRHSAAP